MGIHYTTTYSSWLNQVETWFSILTRDVLRDAVWHSKEQLIEGLLRYQLLQSGAEEAAPKVV